MCRSLASPAEAGHDESSRTDAQVVVSGFSRTRAEIVTNPIDAFVRARLARTTDGESWRPAPRASPETLLRRLAFNLTGLPPTPAEIEAFIADRSPTAYARAVERYLASPAYGERMAMDWLDLARYADTYGYQADVERDMSPYRDWVIRRLQPESSLRSVPGLAARR